MTLSVLPALRRSLFLFAVLLAAPACGPSSDGGSGDGDGGGGGGGGGGKGDGGGGGADANPAAADAAISSQLDAEPEEPAPLDGVPGNFTGTFDGRTYYLHAPPSYDKDTPIPLLIGLHGACTPADEFWGKDGVQRFITAANPGNFILVIPETKGGCNSQDGFCNDFVYWPPSCDISDNAPIDGEADDLVKFADEIQRHYRIDPDQIHLWGHSNGGIFVGIGGFARADYFATLSVFSMGWGAGYISSAAPSRKIPIQFICGTGDASRCDAAQDSEAYFNTHGYDTRMVVIPGAEHKIDDTVPSVSAAAADFAWMLAHPLP